MKIIKSIKTYKTLFLSTFYLSSFTFGGGFVIIPLMKKRFVDNLNWIEEEEMLNLTAIAQSSPGPVAVNASIIIGYKIAGLLGAFVSILGTVLPPLIIISIISLFYTIFKDNRVVNAVLDGMQAGVAAVIADVTIDMAYGVVKEKKTINNIVMIAAFISTYFFNINVIYIIVVCGVIGALNNYISKKKLKEDEER
ncbi:MAG: chromate transporter [Paraclostridium sp.]